MSSRPVLRQRGAALFAMMLILALGASAYLVQAVNSANRTAQDRAYSANVLQQAKAALIGWSAAQAIQSSEETPGRLPCPEAAGNIGDPDNEGIAASNCTLPAVGRLPWRTLGLPKLLDAAGEPLWYAVSTGWARPNSSTLYLGLNSNSAGQLTVDSVANAAAALIIAPGPPLNVQASANCSARTQTRTTPSSTIDLRDYLECQNATKPADATFATSGPTDSFNDQVVAISARDIWSVVEAPVAARITRDVLPTLQAAFGAPYAAPQWGTSATTPILPFAAPFADASSSAFQGAAGTAQGLLPLSRSQNCTAGTDALCDPNFVKWNTTAGAITVTKTSGTATISSSSCASSSASQISCTVSYSVSCFSNICSTLNVRVSAEAQNVGKALRSFSNAAISGFTSATPAVATPLATSGSATVTVDGALPACTPTLFCAASKNVAITVPISIFPDHSSLTAFWTASTSLNWFVQNRWYQLVYYAVAPSHLANGASHDCRTTPACITVSGASVASNLRATFAFMGYSLTGATRPSANLSDYLDSSVNRDGNTVFEQKTLGRSFNDRFFTLSNY